VSGGDPDESDDDLEAPESEVEDDDFLRLVAATSLRPEHVSKLGLTGRRIGGYLVHERIGSGGMGIVYHAVDRDGRDVALKVQKRSGDDAQRRFAREARAALTISHPNVAQVFEIGSDGENEFIAMERVVGQTLRDRIAAGPIELGDAVTWALAITRGLEAAHLAGVIHRDLKPDNVMIATSGDPKILDFGLARWVAQPELASLVTATGSVLGTNGYMSPEQGRGVVIDARSDLFSLGIVVYEMLTGRRPFVGRSPVDVLIATNREAPTPIAEQRPGVPEACVALVMNLLEKAPDRRPASATVVADALVALTSALPPPISR
jgi:eukaryotic-like serine/threonine-protein kinase